MSKAGYWFRGKLSGTRQHDTKGIGSHQTQRKQTMCSHHNRQPPQSNSPTHETDPPPSHWCLVCLSHLTYRSASAYTAHLRVALLSRHRNTQKMAAAVATRASTTTRPAATTATSSKDIWASIIADKLTNPASVTTPSTTTPQPPAREASLLFVGPHAAGKSTLVQSYMFKGREEQPKPTTALEYRYTRTSMKEQLNEEKSISHFWELGGGSTLHELCDVVLVERSVADCLLVIVLDCERTGALVDDAKRYVDMVRKKSEQLLAQMKASGSSVSRQRIPRPPLSHSYALLAADPC